MPVPRLTDAAAVNAALDEFDRLGREAFLETYGFGRAKAYFVHRNRKLYDSKAIAGWHRLQYPDRGPLKPTDFSGGEAQIQRVLEPLGFEVIVQPAADEPTAGPTFEFAKAVQLFLDELRRARELPSRGSKACGARWRALKADSSVFRPLRAAPDIIVNISVGQVVPHFEIQPS